MVARNRGGVAVLTEKTLQYLYKGKDSTKVAIDHYLEAAYGLSIDT